MTVSPLPQPDLQRPRLSGWQWSLRLLLVVVAAMVLLWSWRDAGMSDAGLLWSNRERAVDYLFGKPIDESTLELRRGEIVRNLRTEFQAQARAELEREYDARGEFGRETSDRRLARRRLGNPTTARAPGMRASRSSCCTLRLVARFPRSHRSRRRTLRLVARFPRSRRSRPRVALSACHA